MTGTESSQPEQHVTDLELDLSDELIQQIRHHAAKAGVSPEEWARAAIRAYLTVLSSEDVQKYEAP